MATCTAPTLPMAVASEPRGEPLGPYTGWTTLTILGPSSTYYGTDGTIRGQWEKTPHGRRGGFIHGPLEAAPLTLDHVRRSAGGWALDTGTDPIA